MWAGWGRTRAGQGLCLARLHAAAAWLDCLLVPPLLLLLQLLLLLRYATERLLLGLVRLPQDRLPAEWAAVVVLGALAARRPLHTQALYVRVLIPVSLAPPLPPQQGPEQVPPSCDPAGQARRGAAASAS